MCIGENESDILEKSSRMEWSGGEKQDTKNINIKIDRKTGGNGNDTAK